MTDERVEFLKTNAEVCRQHNIGNVVAYEDLAALLATREEAKRLREWMIEHRDQCRAMAKDDGLPGAFEAILLHLQLRSDLAAANQTIKSMGS